MYKRYMFFYQSEKAEAHKEVKKLKSQRTLLERDLRKRDSATVDKRHELNSTPQELAGVFDQAVQMQVFIILCKHHI
jgi:centromeric protein E